VPYTIATAVGILDTLVSSGAGVAVWRVRVGEETAEAVAYPALVGPLAAGERVLLNTTAVALELGTGGQHFILARLDGEPEAVALARADGHILKLRYTPLQGRVLAVEEEASPYHDLLAAADRLPGTPVVCLGLHSQLAPAAAAVKAVHPDLRVAYVMTDSAALPLAYSRLVATLREAGLLDAVVTAGQAFGGDLEAVNLYSGLVAAAVVAGADVILAGQGPGNAGTGTALGFGGVEQATLLNATAALEGVPVVAPRLSFADPRERHRGLSHHTRTVLNRLALAPATLALPELPPEQAAIINGQLAAIDRPHLVRIVDAIPGIARCRLHDIPLRTMGRSFEEDPAAFLAASAAGRVAGELRA
jgi:hypothetical protein